MAIASFVRSKMLDEHEDVLIDEYLKAYEELRVGKNLTEKWMGRVCIVIRRLHWQEYNWCRWNQGNQ